MKWFVATMVLDLFVGMPQDIPIHVAKPIAVDRSKSGLADFFLSSDHRTLRVVPKRVGTDAVVVREVETGKVLSTYILNVNSHELQVIAKDVQETLTTIDGISVKIRGGRVVVDGEVVTPRDISRIHSVTKMYGDKVRSLVSLSPKSNGMLARIIEREINDPEIRVRIIHGHILLEGFANSLQASERANIIAQMYAQDIVIDEATADKKIVKIHPD